MVVFQFTAAPRRHWFGPGGVNPQPEPHALFDQQTRDSWIQLMFTTFVAGLTNDLTGSSGAMFVEALLDGAVKVCQAGWARHPAGVGVQIGPAPGHVAGPAIQPHLSVLAW